MFVEHCWLSKRVHLYTDNAGVIINPKGEMKGESYHRLFALTALLPTDILGSTVTGPVAKECADLWPRVASNASSIA